MVINKTKIFGLLAVALITSLFIFNLIYKDTHVSGGIKLEKNPAEIEQIAAILAKEINLKINNSYIKAQLESDERLIGFVQKEFGIKKANKFLRDSVPGFYWNITWLQKGVSGIRFSGGSKKEDQNEIYLGRIEMRFDNKGELLKFSQPIDDSISLPQITGEKAKTIAENFIIKYSGIDKFILKDTISEKALKGEVSISLGFNSSGYQFIDQRKIEQLNRADYEFAWTGETGLAGLKKTINISVAGNLVKSFNIDYELPDSVDQDDVKIFRMISTVVFYVLIFILLAITAYKRIRAYEIGFRVALILGSIVAVCSGVEIYLNLHSEMGWETLIPLIIGPVMIGAAVVLVWGTSETITREVWKQKFISIDLATKGYTFHSLTGKSILNGISFGLLTASGILIISFIIFTLPGSFVLEEDIHKHLSSASPALSILINTIYTSIFLVGIFFIFIVSGLKRRFTSNSLLIIICALIWGIANLGDIYPVYAGIIIEALTGLAFVYIFIKTDVLTTLFTLISYYALYTGFVFFTAGNPLFEQSGLFLFVILLFSIVSGVVALYTKDKISEYESITPAFAKNITERQRMQRELEIARDVQMSFLPKTIPSFTGLDIASQCIPALEVGGDYYDFVKLDDTKFGIILGDVSGKGTQAAFYMTLTKGFLKALSRTSFSPAVVLSKMNELFYENVERGTFISMIYGVFDKTNKTFTLSRAGHNPVIVKNSSGKLEMLTPTGLALGLEKGNIFSRTIKEITVPFSTDDVFVFYTDGFTDAMNKQKQEFGEERLTKLVEKSSNLPAHEILNHITKDVKLFMGKAHQHDDMTMVVVKII